MRLRGWLTAIGLCFIFAFFTASIFTLQISHRQVRDHAMYAKGAFDQAQNCKRKGATEDRNIEASMDTGHPD